MTSTAKDFFDVNHASAEGAAWLVEHLKETAAGILLGEGSMIAMAIVVGRRDPKTRMKVAKFNIFPIAVASMANGGEKDAAAGAIRRLAARADAVGVGFMSEAWLAFMSEGERLRYLNAPGAGLAEHPRRVECLVVNWEHRYASPARAGATATMLRDPAGKLTGLGPWEVQPMVDGRFLRWLEREDGMMIDSIYPIYPGERPHAILDEAEQEASYRRVLSAFRFLGVDIPDYMHDGLVEYLVHKRPTGGFLTAVLANDLRGAVAGADYNNMRRIPAYAAFLNDYADSHAWGSAENVKDWLARGRTGRLVP